MSLSPAGPFQPPSQCWPGRTPQAGEGLLRRTWGNCQSGLLPGLLGLKLIKELLLASVSLYLRAIYMLMQARH